MTVTDSSKRADILAATLNLVVRHDIQATAMSRVAEQAGVGMGTIYNYFRSKDVLLQELFREIKAGLADAIFTGYPEDGTYREQFTHVWRRLCRHHMNHPQEFLFAERFAASPYMTGELQAETARRWVRLNRMFEEARAAGVIKDIPLPLFLPMVHGALGAVVRNHVSGLHPLSDETLELMIESFWDAIRRPQAP